MRLLGAEVAFGPVESGVERALVDMPLGEGRLVAGRAGAVLRIPGVATFAIQDGRRVAVDACDGVEPGVLDAWLSGLVASLLLAQRGNFALHANLVDLGGVAVALAGERGAGKTTASLLLAGRGAHVLGDDFLPLDSVNGTVTHRTAGRSLRIDPGTAAALGVESMAAEGAEKLRVPQPAAAPGTLHRIVVLAEARVAEVESGRLSGAEAVRAVLANVYRGRILRRAWRPELFEWAGAVAARVPVHVVRRPAGLWTGDEVAAAVEAIAGE